MISCYNTPSSIADYFHCKRLYWINKNFPFQDGTMTELAALGNFEHGVFEKYFELTKLDWSSSKDFEKQEKSMLDIRIQLVLDYAMNIGRENFPHFLDYFERDLASLRFRLEYLNELKIQDLHNLLNKGFPIEDGIKSVLPWKIEQKLYSEKYDIRGRIDLLYKTENGKLIVEDIKSHTDRFDAFLNREGHNAQLATYAVLAEDLYGLPVKESRIFYSQDLSKETQKITKDSKLKIIKANEDSKNLLDEKIPPKLEGTEAVKCQKCYKRKLCFRLEKEKSLDQTQNNFEPISMKVAA